MAEISNNPNPTSDNSASWQNVGQNVTIQEAAANLVSLMTGINPLQTDSQAPAGGTAATTGNANASTPQLATPVSSTDPSGQISVAGLLNAGEAVALLKAVLALIISSMQEQNSDRISTQEGTMDEIADGDAEATAQYNSGMDTAYKDITSGVASIAGGVIGGAASMKSEGAGKAISGIIQGAGSIATASFDIDKATQDSTATLAKMNQGLMQQWVSSSRSDLDNMRKIIEEAVQMLQTFQQGIHHLGQG
jgi:hypothetical protein